METLKFMPRDSLGRIVYEGDVVTLQSGRPWVIGGNEIWFITDTAVGRNSIKRLNVDLDASPDRTNYERYFADLGTFDDVICAFHEQCDSQCGDCPFDNWGAWTEFAYIYDYGCGCWEFEDWLDALAVI